MFYRNGSRLGAVSVCSSSEFRRRLTRFADALAAAAADDDAGPRRADAADAADEAKAHVDAKGGLTAFATSTVEEAKSAARGTAKVLQTAAHDTAKVIEAEGGVLAMAEKARRKRREGWRGASQQRIWSLHDL